MFAIISRHLIILDSPRFCKTVSSCFSAFMSLVLLRPFSTSQACVVQCKASSQSGMMSSESSSFSLGQKSSVVMYNFLEAHAILVVTLRSGWHAIYAIYVTFTPCFVYLKTQVPILICDPFKLCSMSKESFCHYPTS